MIGPDFAKGDGLVPAIVQDAETKEVLMLAYMNSESWEATLQTGKATYWSRSRKSLWMKGESSGNVQLVKNIFIDCDNDTILLQVEQLGGAACHTGHKSCFYRKLDGGDFIIVGEKIFNPEEVYK
jgi:phosphoribosyl-AMP cyclohydrolase